MSADALRVGVRTITEDDWRSWRDLRLAALATDPQAFGSRLSDWQDASEASWRARLAIPGSRNVAAELDGALVGMASGVPSAASPRTILLLSMWVAPPARGRAVGDALVTAVVDFARARGAREVRLGVVPSNAHAVALYRRHGFVDADPPGPGELGMVRRLP